MPITAATKFLGGVEIADMLFDLLNIFTVLTKAKPGERLQKLSEARLRDSFKQHFPKLFGLGATDEAETWKLLLALLGEVDESYPAAISKLLGAMKDDTERAHFRVILTTMSAGQVEENRTIKQKDGEETVEKNAKCLVDTKEDLRVRTLASLAKIVQAKPPKGGVRVALSVLHNTGLGKDNPIVANAKALWEADLKGFADKHRTKIALWLKEYNDGLEAELASKGFRLKPRAPSRIGILTWFFLKISRTGGYDMPFWNTSTVYRATAGYRWGVKLHRWIVRRTEENRKAKARSQSMRAEPTFNGESNG